MIFLCLIVCAVLVGADQGVKLWTVTHLELGETAPLLPGFTELMRVHNYGAAWSSFSGMRWLLVGVTGAVIIAVAVLLLRRTVRHPLGTAGLTLILAGGLGNLIERVRLGYVVDMFHFEFWPSYPVFNLADIFVVAGVLVALVYYLTLYDKVDSPAARAKQSIRKEH